MGFFDKIKQGLKRTTDAVSEQFSDIMSTFVKIDADSLEQLEEALILSDIGATVAAEATEKVEDIAKHQRIDTPLALRCVLKDVLSDMMDHDTELHLDTKPAVILVIGVNGVGKTTSIGKIASRYVAEGKKVMLSAADTFRAAAADQLKSGPSAQVPTSCATARVPTRQRLSLTRSRQPKHAARMSSSSTPQAVCTTSRT